jgi:hypothetical protein
MGSDGSRLQRLPASGAPAAALAVLILLLVVLDVDRAGAHRISASTLQTTWESEFAYGGLEDGEELWKGDCRRYRERRTGDRRFHVHEASCSGLGHWPYPLGDGPYQEGVEDPVGDEVGQKEDGIIWDAGILLKLLDGGKPRDPAVYYGKGYGCHQWGPYSTGAVEYGGEYTWPREEVFADAQRFLAREC